MRLSDLVVEEYKIREPAVTIYDDAFITDVVFNNVYDDNANNKWCIVFGNSIQLHERANTTIKKYFEGRFKKIVVCGGTRGISNIDNNDALSEASRIKKILIDGGIPNCDIFMDDSSQNTFENIDNAMNFILGKDESISSLSIITSEYHLKRCSLAFLKKYPQIKVTTIPAFDGYTDRDNWFNSSNEWNSGRCTVIWERNLLTKYAKENKIFDCEISKVRLK